MGPKSWLALFTLLALAFIATSDAGLVKKNEGQKTILCYYGSWSCYRYGYGKFDVEASN